MNTNKNTLNVLENVNNLVTQYTFDNFCVGEENELEVSIANQFAEANSNYHMLLAYGDSGSGKTHLINAIGNKISESHPSAKIVYTTASHFCDQIQDAVIRNASSQFRKYYQTQDVLILDDLQELSEKQSCQKQLVTIVNELLKREALVVISCNVHPSYLKEVDDTLIHQINNGVLIELNKGNSEQHIAILKKENERLSGYISLDNIKIIAESDCSIFEKLGCLKTLIAYNDAANGKLDGSLAQLIISRTLNIPSEREKKLWEKFINKAKSVIADAQVCWLNGLRIKSLRDGKLVVEAPS